MNVEQPSVAIVYPEPDLAIIARSAEHLSAQSMSTAYRAWPVVGEKLKRLAAVVNREQAARGEQLAYVSAAMYSRSLQLGYEQSQQVEHSTQLSAALKASTLKALQVSLEGKALSLVASISQAAGRLGRGADDVESIVLQLNDLKLRDAIAAQLAGATQDVQRHVEERKDVHQDRELLTESLALLEKIKPSDYASAFLPTDEELGLIGLASPEVALLKAGIKRLHTLLGKLDEALTYQRMLRERDRLDARISELDQRLKVARQTLSEFADQVAALDKLGELQRSRDQWVAQVRKLVQGLDLFTERVSLTPAGVDAGQLLVQLPGLQQYIGRLYRVIRP